MSRQFGHLKTELIGANIYISCVVDGKFQNLTADTEELDKDLDQLESDIAEYLNTTPDKVRVYNLAIIENLRPQEELQQYWKEKEENAERFDIWEE